MHDALVINTPLSDLVNICHYNPTVFYMMVCLTKRVKCMLRLSSSRQQSQLSRHATTPANGQNVCNITIKQNWKHLMNAGGLNMYTVASEMLQSPKFSQEWSNALFCCQTRMACRHHVNLLKLTAVTSAC